MRMIALLLSLYLLCLSAYPAEGECAGCAPAVCMAAAGPQDNETRASQPAAGAPSLCAFKYLIYFFYYTLGAIALVVAAVMDLATGFSLRFSPRCIDWFRDALRTLDRFFVKIGCGDGREDAKKVLVFDVD